MIRAPRNHTSVYFNPYIKKHWKQLLEIQTKQGFTSFNGMINHNIATLIQDYAVIMNKQNVNLKKRINMYDDTKSTQREKLNVYSDGEELDLLNTINDLRDVVISDMTRRGHKV